MSRISRRSRLQSRVRVSSGDDSQLRLSEDAATSNGQMRVDHMAVPALLTEQRHAVGRDIEAIEILIAEYPFKNIDQRLRLRELQILYRSVAQSLDGAIEMFE